MKNLMLALALITGLSSSAFAMRNVNGRNFTTPVVMSGTNAPFRAGQHCAKLNPPMRLPTPQEFNQASNILKQFPEFPKTQQGIIEITRVYFTFQTGLQWDIAKNTGHQDGGLYYGFDFVTCTDL